MKNCPVCSAVIGDQAKKCLVCQAVLWFLHFLVLGLIVPLMRFGMLAFVAYYIFFNLTHVFLLTTDVSAWYFNATVFSAVVIIGLAAYGFYTSIAGQPVLQSKMFKELEI